MAGLNWDDSLSVNIKEIDEQHKKLIEMLKELSDAMRVRKGKDVIGKILNGLISYTDTHFKTEEKYFKAYRYPETISHQKEHEGFVKKATDFKRDFDNGKLMITIDVLNFLSNWVTNHIKKTDKKYSAFFNEKGLK